MARKESKKKKKQKHKKSSHKKDKRKQSDSFEDVSSESSSDLSTSSSSDSSSESEGEENSALTKAKAMLKFRETFQKRLEQRERAAGKSKSNVKELFDSSVPLDIEDLKAEFDNAPVPSLDNDDILKGGQERRKPNKVQDFSNVTVGKLPIKGPLLKAKPEKLVNQFFAKELVNPKPKASIKIGIISQKIQTPEPMPVALAPGLEICPVSPPDSHSIHKRSHQPEQERKDSDTPESARKSAPRIIHQISEPDPEPLPSTSESDPQQPSSEQLVTEDSGTHLTEEQAMSVEEQTDPGTSGQEDGAAYKGPGPAPLPPANYCSAPVKRDPIPAHQSDNQEFHGPQHPPHGMPPRPLHPPQQHGHQSSHPRQLFPPDGHPHQQFPPQMPQQGTPPHQFPPQFPQQGGPSQQFLQQGGPSQQFPQNGGPTQQLPQQGGPPQQFPQQGGPPLQFPQQGGPPQQFQHQGGPPQQFPQQGGPPQQFPHQGGPPQRFALHDMKQQQFAPKGPPQQIPMPREDDSPSSSSNVHPSRIGALAAQLHRENTPPQQNLPEAMASRFVAPQTNKPQSQALPPPFPTHTRPQRHPRPPAGPLPSHPPAGPPQRPPGLFPPAGNFAPGGISTQGGNFPPGGIPPPAGIPPPGGPPFRPPSGLPQHPPVPGQPHRQSQENQAQFPVSEPHKSNETPSYDPNKQANLDNAGSKGNKGHSGKIKKTALFDPKKLPPGLDPSKMQPGFDPSLVLPGINLPIVQPDYDPNNMSSGFDQPKVQPRFDAQKMPAEFEPSKNQPVVDPSKRGQGPDSTRMSPGFNPNKIQTGFDPSQMHSGFDPSKMPAGFDPSKLPAGFDRSKITTGFDPSKMPPGFDTSKIPPRFDSPKMPSGFDPSKLPPGFDLSKIAPGFDPSKMPSAFDPSKMPPGFDTSKMPPYPMPSGMKPGSRPPFDPTRFPFAMPGRPPFDPALMRPGMPTMFRPPHSGPPPDREKRSRSRERDHDRDREHREGGRDRHHESRRSYSEHKERGRGSYDRGYEDRHSRERSPSKKVSPNSQNGHPPAQWNNEQKPRDKAVSPTTPEIDPRAVREALKFLQGTTDIDDDVVRKALMTIKSKQKSEKSQQKSYSAAPTAYNYVKPPEPPEDEPMSPEIQPYEAEKIVQQVQEQERLAQQQQFINPDAQISAPPVTLEETGEILEEDVEQATGPEIPVTGLPEPDYTPAADLDKSDWQIAPSKDTTEETVAGYTFPPDAPSSQYDYSEYYMHYYQQAYHQWNEEKEQPIEARFPVSQGYGHKRALEKGGTVKGSGRAILFNKEEIQGLVLKRKKIAQEMVKNPESSELMDKMEAVQHKLNECGVTETEIAMMETSQMQSAWKKRRQEELPAWTRPDLFYGLPTVRSAVGMAILKKQGWVVGQVLGRGCPYGSAFGAGSLQPLEFLIKTDQAGLLCAEERAAIKAKKYGDVMPSVITEPLPAPRSTISGRHPIAALADYCHQEKWKQPAYTLVREEGVDHKKLFVYQVTVKCGNFTTPTGAPNKRQAKSDAAAACLERLGLMTSLPPGYS